MRITSSIVALCLAVLAACDGDSAAPDAGMTPSEPPAEWATCSEASDCVVVEVGCCDHCNGGRVVSVNAAYEAQTIDLLRPPASECPDGCTLLGCADELPVCEEGVCGHITDPGFGPGCGALGEAACKATTGCAPIYGWNESERCTATGEPDVFGLCVQTGTLSDSCGQTRPPWDGTVAEKDGGGPTLVFPVHSDGCLPGWTHWDVVSCPACSDQGEADCGKYPYCMAFSAVVIDDPCQQEPDGAATFVACDDDPGGGGGAITCGTRSEGQHALFPSTALPTGWAPCDTSSCGAECAGLDDDVCAETPGCAAFFGYTVAAYCLNGRAMMYGGCGPEPGGCDDALTCGQKSGTDEQLVFPSSCLPPGWEPCGEIPCGEGCEELDQAGCTARPDCFLYMGVKGEACEPPIESATEFVACGPPPTDCGRSIRCGRSQGELFWFPSGCLPPGYTPCDTTGCAGCSGLDQAQCAANDGCMALLGAPVADWCANDFSTWMSVYAGCIASTGCGDAETCGMGPAGEQLAFPSTCLPSGWVGCPEDPCAGGQCAAGEEAPVGKLCVRGTPAAEGEVLAPGEPLVVQVSPSGCWSSSCTTVHESSCAVTGAGPFEVSALFCLEAIGDVCTPDCSGGGFTSCTGEASLPEGTYTVTHGDLSVTVTVPDTIPFGGACTGSPF